MKRSFLHRAALRTAAFVLFCLASSSWAYAGSVTVSPTSLSFGNQVQGTPSAVKTVTLTNGQTKALTITSITSTLSDYTQTSNCPFSPSTLAAGASCTISVTFTPAVLGSRSATLKMNDDASNSPQKVTLNGTGVAAVTTTPSSISFGNVAVGKKSSSKTVTVHNNQTTSLTITSITTNLNDYTYTTVCPLSPSTLGAGQTCTISVYFTPATAGLRSGTLTVNTTAGNPTVSLSGTGIQPAVVNPGSLTFAGQALGTTSPGQNVTLTNNQTTSLKITSISSSVTDFGYTTTCPFSPSKLAAGASCTASVTFSPKAAGSRTGTLSFNDDASNTPQVVSLSGTGNPAAPVSMAVSPANASLAAGQTLQFTATCTYSDGTAEDLTNSATWTSSATSAATIASGGLATGVAQGSTTIAATAKLVSGTTTLTVTGVTLASISLSPGSTALTIGNAAQFIATGTYSDGSTQNITASASWDSSSSSIATVSGGLVTGVADGIANITASLSGVTSPAATADIGTAADYYVATNGNDSWSGSLWDPNSAGTDGPFATIARAQTAVQAILANRNGRTAPITVLIRGGNYYQQALTFTAADSGTSTLPVIWRNYPNESPFLSGGMVVTGWTNVGNNTYQTTLPATAKYFENLFYNGGRRLRPRLGGPLGTYHRVSATVYLSGAPPPSPPPDPNCSAYVNGSGWACFDRFKFSPGDLSASWTNLNPPYPAGDIELVVFEWWTAPKMRISSIDSVNRIVYLTGPTVPVALQHGLIPTHRYIVENVKDLLTQPGQWFLDLSASPWTLTYIANPNEDPLTDTVVVPQSAQVWTGTGLQYVTFIGLTFAHDNFTVSAKGYPSAQQEPALTAAVSCYNCQHVTFDSDIITQTSGSGMEFQTADTSKTTAYNTFQNGAVYDIGGMGIRVGTTPSPYDTDANVPQFTIVQNTLVEGYGRVFPTAVGIVQGSGHDNTYTHNDIYDGYHSGIEICLAGGCLPGIANSSGTFNNVASFNHIFDLYQGVTNDGGAIYVATGRPAFSAAGNKILNNKIHDISDASIIDADGYGGTGINLDDSTGLVTVQNNLIYRTSALAVNISHGPQLPNLANTITNNIFAYSRRGMIANGNPYPTYVCPANPVTIFNTSGNLFYFDRTSTQSFYLQQGCVYSCGFPATDLHNWQSNLYWRTDGGFSADAYAFHTQPTENGASLCGFGKYLKYYDFAGWQGLGEDIGSLAAKDPGFNHPAYPSDDYSLPGGSPGVGFVVFDPSQAGRSNPLIKPTDPKDIPATFPTATLNPASDY